MDEEKARGKNVKAGGAGGRKGPLYCPGGRSEAKPCELLDFSLFKHSRRDIQGVIFKENEMEES